MTRLTSLCMTALLLAACADDASDDGDVTPQTDPRKESVRASLEDGDGENDQRCEETWVSDGVCDDFCPGGDTEDCGIVCAAIWSPADGECDESDPCGPFTDEDCQTPPVDGGPIACAEFWSEADGACDWSNPCSTVQDEDCQTACVPPTEGIACIAIVYETNDVCEAGAGCEANDPVDCHACLR